MSKSARPKSVDATKRSHIPIPRSKSTDQPKVPQNGLQEGRPRSSVRSHIKMARARANESALFEQQRKPGLSLQVIKQARLSGQLNLSNRGMIEVPDVVWNLNSQTEMESQHGMTVSLDSTDGERWWDYLELSKLILASNKISTVPSDISALSSLTVLDLHDNQLVGLPVSLRELKHLTKLHLSHNRLTEIPEGVFQLTDLRALLISHNKLFELNDDIGNLSRLEELDLSNNELCTIPNTIGFLSRATSMNLSNNCIQFLPGDIGSMTALKMLDLTRNELIEVPEEIGQLIHLEQLYLRHNKLVSLPDIYEFPNLKELHVGNNNVAQLSDKLFECLVTLRVLDLRDNKISQIGEEIRLIHGLERLDLTNNDLSNLPNAIAHLPHLKSLSLDGNPLRFIRRDILQRGTVQLLRWLKDRQGGADQASSERFPTGETMTQEQLLQLYDKHKLRNTRALDVSNRGVSGVPIELFKMANEVDVTTVDLSKNVLVSVPESLAVLAPNITEMNLGFNRLTSLPDVMGLCTRLVFLDLRNNRLTNLPAELSNAQQLRELSIAFNRFKSFPTVIFELSSLEILFASDNGLQELPWEGLSRLTQLATLDVTNNDLMTVPPQIGNLTQLRSLLLEGNPFRHPRPAVIARGTQSLLEYLRDRIPT